MHVLFMYNTNKSFSLYISYNINVKPSVFVKNITLYGRLWLSLYNLHLYNFVLFLCISLCLHNTNKCKTLECNFKINED